MKELNERLVSLRIGETPVNGLPEACPDKREYLPPKTQRTSVETEGGFCTSEPMDSNGSISTNNQDPIEVDEYNSIGGDDGKLDITFD